jgi:hypothetical protein
VASSVSYRIDSVTVRAQDDAAHKHVNESNMVTAYAISTLLTPQSAGGQGGVYFNDKQVHKKKAW